MTKTIKIKRVYEEYSAEDGYRILVDRLWPRGVRKENLHYDLWAKELAPSPELRKWYHTDPENRWKEFRNRYIFELSNSEQVRQSIQDIGHYNTITLLYAAKNPVQNHAQVLKEYLDKVFHIEY
ncbi:MAG: DUF488 domain-containing protein [Barnesiella sp.]